VKKESRVLKPHNIDQYQNTLSFPYWYMFVVDTLIHQKSRKYNIFKNFELLTLMLT